MLFVLALAFLLQSYLVQTHIHGLPAPDAGFVHSAAAAASLKSVPAQTPPSDALADCALCQLVVHAGAFDMPLITGLVLGAERYVLAPQSSLLGFHGNYFGHDQHQRGPPHS